MLQPAGLDGGIYAHQVRVDPAEKMVVLVTRGNAAGVRPEDPGAMKVFGYRNGILSNRLSIAPNGGYGFQSRNLDFHPTAPWVYLALEVQSKLVVFRRTADGASIDPTPLFSKDTVADPAHLHHPAQQAGPVSVHPNGRFVYTTNRSNGTIEVQGRRIFEGGENSIAVFSIDVRTGEPSVVQRIDTRGFHARTFSFDEGARILVAANQSAVTVRADGVDTLVPACLSVFRMGSDGKLTYVRKYDVATGQGASLTWSGMVTLLPVHVAAQTPASLDIVLARLHAYLADYAQRLPATVAAEHYVQRAATGRIARRELESQFGLVRLPGVREWLGFRDVLRVDGTAIPDHEGRLEGLFQDPGSDAHARAMRVAEESARFNIGAVQRTINNPAVVLELLDGRNAARMRFSREGDATVSGIAADVIRFEETSTPTIIQVEHTWDAPARGRAWVDPASGILVRADCTVETKIERSGNVTVSIAVEFRPDSKLGFWVPASMQEEYRSRPRMPLAGRGIRLSRVIASGRATYDQYRQFAVETDEQLGR